MLDWISNARKAIVTAVGTALTVLTLLDKLPLPAQAHGWVAVVLGVVTTLATYLVPNKQTPAAT